MYVIENKILLITIIALVVISINAKKVPLSELSSGDIININDFQESSTETTGNIFNGYNAEELFKTSLSTKTHYVTIKKEKCLSFESLVSYSYPKIVIDDIEYGPAKIIEDTERLKYNYFGIREDYISYKYLYGIVEVCKVEKTQNLSIQVINESDFPLDNYRMNYKLLLDATAVLRLKGNNETHFVSSITTGDCLLQVYVNEAEKCDLPGGNHKYKNSDDFLKFSLHRSRVIIASNKRDLENTVNEELNTFSKSLVELSNDLNTFTRILDLLDQYVVIRLKFPESKSKVCFDRKIFST